MARLLGASSGTRVCRYENFRQAPSVPAIFAYEIIFKTPIRELFAGTYQSVDRAVRLRAKELMSILANSPTNPRTARKIQLLRAVVESECNPIRRD